MQDNQFPWLCIQTLFLGSFWVYPVGLFPCHFTFPHKKFDCMKFGIKKKKRMEKTFQLKCKIKQNVLFKRVIQV